MFSPAEIKIILKAIGFSLEEGVSDTWIKEYPEHSNYKIRVNIDKEEIDYGNKIILGDRTTCNFKSNENFVVLECVDRLLEKGYQPKNIILEKTWATGHGTSGRLDILVTKKGGTSYLMIECKTWGAEFDKEFNKLQKDGGQLFTYFQQDKNADILMLYASEIEGKKIKYRNEIIKIEDDYRQTGNVKDFYDRWNKLPKSNGVFDSWVNPYEYKNKALIRKELKALQQEDSSFIFNRFLEILRHNVVSDKPNAFNKIFTLFLCKIMDEFKNDDDELHFQWLEGKDDHISFQKRLTDLYNKGMKELLEKHVTDISDEEIDKKFRQVDDKYISEFKNILTDIRLKKNNEFAIKEVFDNDSFLDNAKVVKEVVELLQGYQIRYTYRQQFLSDFFELLLTTGLKQESGQFFTPVPLARFIIKSIPLQAIAKRKIEEGSKNDLLPAIIDYAAGSGHFLTESMEELQKYIDKVDLTKLNPNTAKSLKAMRASQFDWAVDYVYGIEKDYRLVKTAKVSCYLHGDGLANVIHGDGLANFITTKEYKQKLKKVDAAFKQENKQFDVVISNPPYSVSAFKGTLNGAEEAFDLHKRLTDQSSEIECLFIERAKQLLKDGGIAGIILPSSILSNTGIYTKAREIILNYFEIVAIAELGSNTFMATGTNTVTLFLRRRNNYDCINIKAAVEKFAINRQDVTINSIGKPITKYVAHVWEGITFNNYVTLFKKEPDETIKQHEIYQEYSKKINAKNEQEKWNAILELEKEKLFYFIVTYPQKLILVKTGEKNEEKQFLGYEFSNRRGSEGIHPIQRGKNIDECTKLYDTEVFDNPQKASTYIYKAFEGNHNLTIDTSMEQNIAQLDLVDTMTFDRVDFEKNISLAVKKKVKYNGKWELVKLGDVAEIFNGGTPDTRNQKYWDGEVNWATLVDTKNKYLYETQRKITLEGMKNSNAILLPINTVIFSSRATIGDISIAKIRTCTNQGYKNFVCDTDKINYEFLYYILKNQALNIASLASGMTYPEISKSAISDFKIPLPPIRIQEKIVAEIEVLEKKENIVKEKIRNLKTSSNELANNIIISGKHRLERLENIAFIGSGGTPSREVSEYWTNGNIPWLRSEVCKEGYVDKANEFITELGLKKSNAKYFEKDTTLIALVGATKGKTAYLTFKATTNQNIAGIYSKDSSLILNEFIFCILKSMYFEIIKNLGQYDMLNLTAIKNIKIPLPPIKEQQKTIDKLELIKNTIEELAREIENIPNEKEIVLKKYL